MSQEDKKIVIKLTPRVNHERERSSSRRVLSQQRVEAVEEFNIISQERENLTRGRDSLLREYYDNLEKVVFEINKAREFLTCVRDLR